MGAGQTDTSNAHDRLAAPRPTHTRARASHGFPNTHLVNCSFDSIVPLQIHSDGKRLLATVSAPTSERRGQQNKPGQQPFTQYVHRCTETCSLDEKAQRCPTMHLILQLRCAQHLLRFDVSVRVRRVRKNGVELKPRQWGGEKIPKSESGTHSSRPACCRSAFDKNVAMYIIGQR